MFASRFCTEGIVTKIDTLVLSNQFIRSFHTTLLVRDTVIQGDILPMYQWKNFTYTEKIGSSYIYPYFFDAPCYKEKKVIEVCNYADTTIADFYLYPDRKYCRLSGSTIEERSDLSLITIYPNPSSDRINIETEQPLQYLMYNLFGQVVASGISTNQQINIQELPNASY